MPPITISVMSPACKGLIGCDGQRVETRADAQMWGKSEGFKQGAKVNSVSIYEVATISVGYRDIVGLTSSLSYRDSVVTGTLTVPVQVNNKSIRTITTDIFMVDKAGQ